VTAVGPDVVSTGVVGRQNQLARLRTLIDRVPVQGQVLVLLGEAGIGKSTLLASAAQEARAAGMRVLWATGRESETNIAFAGLHRLLSPVLGAAADLERRQARALLGALGLAEEPAAADLLGTGLATLTLLSDSSEAAPVLVIVDDAHWLDRSTLDILAFAGSRLETERVVLLLAARGHVPPAGFDRGFTELPLAALSAADAGLLLDRQPQPPRGAARTQVLAQAAGNPLALLELPECGVEKFGVPLPRSFLGQWRQRRIGRRRHAGEEARGIVGGRGIGGTSGQRRGDEEGCSKRRNFYGLKHRYSRLGEAAPRRARLLKTA